MRLTENDQIVIITTHFAAQTHAFQATLTKIYEFDSTLSGQQNVISFYIPVDGFVVMQMMKSLRGGKYTSATFKETIKQT